MKADATDRFYNVGTGIRTSLKELAEIVLDITGSDVGIRYEPQGLTFVKNRIGDPTNATKDLGYTYGVDLDQGLRELVAWRRSHIDEVAARRARAAGEQDRIADLEEPVVAEAGAE
jgi:UDP-glucose 4-epimerase